MHPPQLGAKWGGASYTPNVAYIYLGEILLLLFMLLNILPHFLLQIFFSYFPPLKLRFILWSEKYGSSFLAQFPPQCCDGDVTISTLL